MSKNPDILTIPEAAEYCGVTRMSMWRWVKAGKIKALTTPGGHHRINKSDIEKAFQSEEMHSLNESIELDNHKKVSINNEDILTIPEAAEYCGVTRMSMWRWVKVGKIKAFVTPGGHHRIIKSELEKLLKDKDINTILHEENSNIPKKTTIIIKEPSYSIDESLSRKISVSTAIEELIDEQKRPLKRAEIIELLDGQFTEGNITAALGKDTRFISIGEGFYDCPENWQQRNINDFIKLLPEPVAEFARYLVSKNNCSYKLVLALVFIRGMDNNGSFYLPTLKERFFSYYLSRKKKGLVVEADNVTISKIESIEDVFIRSATIEPIKSFIRSMFFIQNSKTILLQRNLVELLSNTTTQHLLIITLLKAIDDYFLQLSPYKSLSGILENPAISNNQPSLKDTESSVHNTHHLEKELKDFTPLDSYNNNDYYIVDKEEENSFSISIKTRDKAKIKI